MSSHLPFPLADFYDALVAQNAKQKLQPFIAQFRKKNIYIIYQCVNRLIQIITNKSQLPVMKFNALMATRYFFDTCEYPAIIFIEVFMLPVIYEIALEKYLKRSQEGIQLYFVDRGAQNTRQMRRLGLNYVQLAIQFIFNSAKVKPYRIVQNQQLKQQSNFARTVKVLKSKGIQEQQKFIYFIPSYPVQTRKKFLKKLKHLSPQPYISFVISEFLEQINLNKKCDLDIKKLLLFGDSFLTSTIVQIIQQQLGNMGSNFINKKKYLNLLNDLIRSGEIQSIFLINTADFLNEIAQEIGKVKGSLGSQQGQYIYPKIQASKQQKKQFFIQFLRVLQIWAFCMPITEQGQQSDALKIFEDLKNKNFVFPKNVILKKIKDQTEQNLRTNQQRNDTLMKIIEQDDRASSRNAGSYVSSKGQFKFHFPQYKEKTSYVQLDELQDRVFEAKKKLARLALKKEQLQENMNFLHNFVNNWDTQIQNLDIQDQDPHQLQILIDQGDLCCQQYKLVTPIYQLFLNRKINHDTFLQKIEFLQNGDESSNNKSQVKNSLKNNSSLLNGSIDHRLQASKKSSNAQSVRKQVHNQYFNQYGHHYNREEDQSSLKNEKLKEKVNSRISEDKQILKKKEPSKISSDESKIMSEEGEKISESLNKNKIKNVPNIKKVESYQKFGQKPQKNYKSSENQSQNKFKVDSKKVSFKSQSKVSIEDHIKANNTTNKYPKSDENMFTNPIKRNQQTFQKMSQISSSQSQSSSEQKIQIKKQSSKKSILKTEKLQTQKYLQKNTQNKRFQDKNSKYQQQHGRDQEQHIQKGSRKKSFIKHSVISKSSYHSQPTQQKIIDTDYHESGSMMVDFQNQNNQNQGAVTIKKSSIKRTQNSGMRNSSHKKQVNQKQGPSVGQAVSPFKKKISSSKDTKIKQSYIKQFQFIKQNKKPSNSNIDQNYAYEKIFQKNQEYQKSQKGSQISSDSQSVIKKRINKKIQKQRMRQTNRIELNDYSQYYNDDPQILRRDKYKLKMKTQSSSPAKNILLFDSQHPDSSRKHTIGRINEEYDIKDDNINKYTEKASQFSRNGSKFIGSKGKNSGIKLISKNQKQFDTLYQNQYNHPYGQSGFNGKYQEVTSEFRQTLNQSKSPKNSNGFGFQNSSERQRQSYIRNQDYSPVSLKQINEQIQKYKNMPKRHKDPQISQIHEPDNLPMLYSYCSQKSIHSKLTDSHTRKGNNKSSNCTDFKACFLNMDKQTLPLDLTKSKAVSNSFSMDKAHNFIDFRCSNAKSSSKVNTVVDAISQKNAKNSILLYKLERQKNRLVQNLQNKIKSLEVNGKMMKTKFAVKDQSIRDNNDLAKQFSERQLKLNSRQVKNSRQSSNQNNSFSNNDLSKRINNHGITKSRGEAIIENSQRPMEQNLNNNIHLMNTKMYQNFFNQFLMGSNKKCLVKKKGVLVKNQQIQIGYMISKKDKNAIVSIFITPLISSIKNVLFEIQCDHNLSYKLKPNKIDLIQTKKQQISICSFSVQNIPFKIPSVKIKFDGSRNYKINNYTIGIPCTMVAFCDLIEPDQQSGQICFEQFRTQMFKCQKKISKPQKIKQIFPQFKISKSSSKVLKFEGKIKYQNYYFNIILSLSNSGFIAVEGFCKQKQNFNPKFLQCLLSTLRFILQQQQTVRQI